MTLREPPNPSPSSVDDLIGMLSPSVVVPLSVTWTARLAHDRQIRKTRRVRSDRSQVVHDLLILKVGQRVQGALGRELELAMQASTCKTQTTVERAKDERGPVVASWGSSATLLICMSPRCRLRPRPRCKPGYPVHRPHGLAFLSVTGWSLRIKRPLAPKRVWYSLIGRMASAEGRSHALI